MVSWNSARRKQRRFAELSAQDRWYLLQACGWLPLVAMGRRIVSFKRLLEILGHAFPCSSSRSAGDESDLETAHHMARIVQIAASHSPLRANCLERSLVLWKMLRQQGLAAELRLGVRKNDQQFEAHAWVEYQDTVLNDAGDVRERFVVLQDLAGQVGQ